MFLGNIDGTFKSQSKQYGQLFILQVSLKDRNGTDQTVPVGFGWLPDKLFWSYYKFILMILLEFDRRRPQIKEMTGSGSIRLGRLKCDFEYNIHRAFSMFSLEGCFFHYTQVPLNVIIINDPVININKAIWRKVQSEGMVVAYMSDKDTRYAVCYTGLHSLK